MNKNLAIILLSLAVGILLVFLLLPDKQPDSHKVEHDIAQADNKLIIEQRNAGLRTIDSLHREISKRDDVAVRLKIELASNRSNLDKSTAKAVQLAREVKQLKDTSAFGQKCDSLAIEVDNFAFLYNAYKAYSDSLSARIDSNKVDYEAALKEQRRLYDELYIKYEQLYNLYNILFKNYQQAGKRLKREKLKTRVASVLALVGAGLFIAK